MSCFWDFIEIVGYILSVLDLMTDFIYYNEIKNEEKLGSLRGWCLGFAIFGLL